MDIEKLNKIKDEYSKIINTAYRLCGYGGLVLVFYVIYNFIKNMNKVENERKNENTKVK